LETKVAYDWINLETASDGFGPATNIDEARISLGKALNALTDARFDKISKKHCLLTAKDAFDKWTAKLVAQAWDDGKITGSNEKARQLSRDVYLAEHTDYQLKANEIKAMDLAAAHASAMKEQRQDEYSAACLVLQSFTADKFAMIAVA